MGLWYWQNWRHSEFSRTGLPQHPVLPEKIQTDPNEVSPELGSPNDLANFMRLIVVDWPGAVPESRWAYMHRREVTARTRALAFYRGRSFARPGEPARGPENNHRPPRQLFFLAILQVKCLTRPRTGGARRGAGNRPPRGRGGPLSAPAAFPSGD